MTSPSEEQANEHELILGIDFGDEYVTFAATNHVDISIASRYPATVTFTDGELVTGEEVPDSVSEPITDFLQQTPQELTDDRQVPLALYLRDQLKEFEGELPQTDTSGVKSTHGEERPTETQSHGYTAAVLSLPAGLTGETVSTIVSIVKDLGIPDVRTVRRPTPVIRNFAQKKPEGQIAGIHLTHNRLELGLYSVSAEKIEVLARQSIQNLGRERISSAIARGVIERTARDIEATVEYDETALQRVTEAVDTILRDGDTQDNNRLELELDDGVRIVAGDKIISNRISIEETLDQSLIQSALDDYTSQLIESLSEFVDSISESQATAVVISGSYPGLTVLNDVVSGIWNIEPTHSDRPFEQMAVDAAETFSAEAVSLTETADHLFSVAALDESGIEPHLLTETLRSVNQPVSFSLRTQSPDQQVGRFEFHLRHPVTDEIEATETVTLAGVQPSGENTKIQMTCTPTSETIDGADKLTFDVEAPANEDIQVLTDEKSDAPWLVHGTVPETADLPEVSEKNLSYSRLTDFDSDTDTTVNRERVAEIIHRTRTNIWSHSVKDEQAFSPSQMETVLREFDSQLERIGIEFFEPDIGAEIDPRRHRVREVEDSQEEEGTILEVLRPGVSLGGEPTINAEVVIADD